MDSKLKSEGRVRHDRGEGVRHRGNRRKVKRSTLRSVYRRREKLVSVDSKLLV